MDDLSNTNKIIGLKRSLEAVNNDLVSKMYLAGDTDEHILKQLLEAAQAHDVGVEYCDSMLDLGRACSIDVGASVVVILK